MVEQLLRAFERGELSLAEAARLLRAGHLPGGPHARFDVQRTSRTGLPEVLLGEGKALPHFEELLRELHRTRAGVLLSRLTPGQMRVLSRRRQEGWDLDLRPQAAAATLHPREVERPLSGRRAALLTAGTADARVAEEVRWVLEALGGTVACAFDVGVAGLHRLSRALPSLRRRRPGVYVVCAGREGALATVVAGLVDRPVIAVPTSQGYGRGGRGEGALTAMLQSCAPMAVVNIDAGVPAALLAAQILRLSTEPPSGKRTRRVTRRKGHGTGQPS
ncbi:MAG: nickel pincer cofactor biosynthesis protein LarB [Euryarchaeota archaeon]|nr:nickel pincer cofactor biosynthesis protein LarB [Euryarchaeota archaeon]MDE1835886.1 nickel pincer cofactor biosynthesis protein LarB [Euryarchaeota archaeon]MDE2044436.1 nickel pincer cofactor biosynthesis protein LarB [Thermoplasmata archaeon]